MIHAFPRLIVYFVRVKEVMRNHFKVVQHGQRSITSKFRASTFARTVQPESANNTIVLVTSQDERSKRSPYREITGNLFRALLRQCTYLPDAAASKYIHYHIVSRFRNNCPRRQFRAQRKPHEEEPASQKRIITLVRDGIKNLRLLIRANDGHPEDLYKVLATTYGRRGKRKHALQRDLKAANIPDLEAVAQLPKSPDKKKKAPCLGVAMEALARSQKAQKGLGFQKAQIKDLKPMIEKKNAWGRPMPVNRVRNKQKEWYAMTLDAILPPLPEHEWNSLRGLATGRIPWEGPVPRRSQAVVRDGDGRRIQKKVGARKSRDESEYSEFINSYMDNPHRPDVKTNPHALTPRYMRGLWARVFAQCPMMKWDPNTKKWDVLWGNVEKDKEMVLSPHHEEDMSLFEDIK